MGTTADVRDYSGQILRRGTHDFLDLLRVAREVGLPLLSGVDEYDDTTFNRRQAVFLAKELSALRRSKALLPQIDELTALLLLLDERPHRYLVFNGD